MSFRVEVRENNDRVLAVEDLAGELAAILPRGGDSRYPVLRYLDEYGDTYLNSLQVRDLLTELGHLREEVTGEAATRSLDALVALADKALETPHRFLIFIGD